MTTLPTHALTLWRPWAWAIVHGPKRVENRTWKPPASFIGKRIGIHAGQNIDRNSVTFIELNLDLDQLPPEAWHEGLIGSARLVRCIEKDQVGTFEEGQGNWFFGPYGWLLDEVEAFPAPIPMKGAQGLWRVGFVPADALIAAGLK